MERTEFPLAHGQSLAIESADTGNLVRLVGPDGFSTLLTIRITPQGPVLEFQGGLALATSGELTLHAGRLTLHGRDGISLSSGGDITVDTPGDFSTDARIINLDADRGNINLHANDDIRIQGERVMVNCEQG
jgi:uncharacterized protein (DUF2345 family)